MADPAPTPPRRYLARLTLAGALVVTELALIFTVGIHREQPGAEPVPAPQRPQPRAAAPPRAVAAPADRPDASDQEALDAWAERVSSATDIPARALAAYGRAEMWLRAERPRCGLSWATLAGIGDVESRHGRVHGARLDRAGRAAPPIVGVPLDGSPGVREIRDTDSGRLDGDRTWDRAVGPLQFLPETWARWGARATRDDRRPDPHDIDDAALAAGRYLCARAGDDLGTPAGWWGAVLAYNRSVEYGQNVFTSTEQYATATT